MSGITSMIPNREFKLNELSQLNSSASEIDRSVVKGNNFILASDYDIVMDDELSAPTNTIKIQAALDYCATVAKTLILNEGTLYINDELNVRCNLVGMGYDNTKIRPSSAFKNSQTVPVTKWKYEFSSSKKAIEYEGTLKAIINLDNAPDNILIDRLSIYNNIYLDTDAKLSTVPYITGVRGGRLNNLISNPACNRMIFGKIKINGFHTGMDITGFILTFDNVYITSCINGIIASEFNNINGSIKMENVKKPFNIYDAYQVHLTSFINEGFLTWSKSELDRVKSFTIDGIYHEGGVMSDCLFSIGKRTPIDVSLNTVSTMGCNNVTLNGFHNVTSSSSGNTPVIKVDICDSITINGNVCSYKDIPIEYTANTTDKKLNLTNIYNSKIMVDINKPSINFAPNSKLKYFRTRTLSGYRNTLLNVTVESLKIDGSIRPIYSNMLKITNNENTSNGNRISLSLQSPLIKTELLKGDEITVGTWVYVPAQSFNNSNTATMPYISSALIDLVNGSDFSEQVSIRAFDKWVFVTASKVFTKTNLDAIEFSFRFSPSQITPIGTYMYLGGLFIFKNIDKGSIYDQKFDDMNLIGYDNGESMTYFIDDFTNLTNHYINININDLVINKTTTLGAFKYRKFTNNDRLRTATYTYDGFPQRDKIPTTNQGVGTIWANNGILTLGS